MEPSVAEAVLAATSTLPKKLKIADAEIVVRRWLRARGLVEDRWGNFAIVVSQKSLDRGIAAERYHFTDRQIQHQARSSEGRGDWHNHTSTPLIEAANTLITKAGEALGRTDIVEHATKAKAQRAGAAEKRAETVKSKRVDEDARNLARKYIAKKYRADVLKNYTNVPIESDRLAEMKQALEFHEGFFRGAVLGQRTMPTDDLFASIDLPPILPIFGGPISYEWVEKEGGVPYSVFVTNKEKGKAIVKIGASGGLLDIDPTTMSISGQRRENIQGDGWIDGILIYANGRFNGALVVISVKSEKKKGVGSRLLNLWCRMMAGYGITRWVAVAVGPEGQEFFNALEKRGRIRIDRRDVNWVIQCL